MAARRSPVVWAFAALPLVAGIVEALRSAWVCDDIFISFRYVDNLLHGEGLVYNAGERVEGFTHFLWVIVLAAVNRLGLDLVAAGRYLPIVSFVAVVVVLFRRSLRRGHAGWLGLPIAAWCVALHKDAQIYASSGLETSVFGLLLLLGLLVVTGPRQRVGLAAALYALATLVRPEGVLYTAAAGLYIVWRWRGPRPAMLFAGVWLALVAPVLVFRVLYYGDLLPNTYYAKSAGRSYWSQGWHYTRLYFTTYLVLLPSIVAIPCSWFLSFRRGPGSSSGPAMDASLLAGAQVMLTILYVTRLGGDFMFARFFIPATPLMYLVLEDVLRSTGRRWVEVGSAVILVGCTLYGRVPRDRTFAGRERTHGIVNEANYYTSDLVSELRRQGEILGASLRGTPARVGLLSGQDAVAYFGRLSYALEPHGLTDVEIARMPLQGRGRPGHEKAASLEHLLRRNIHFRLRYGWTVGLRLHEQIRFADLYGEIILYDRQLMDSLKGRPGISFVDFPTFLDDYVGRIAEQNRRRLLDDYLHFQLFYFNHNHDPQRLARLREALLQLGVPEDRLRDADRLASTI